MPELIKYYTPSIEEFHIGFEFDYLNKEKTWNSYRIEGRTDIPHRIDWEANKWRVKYLDREDIESLGFKKEVVGSKKEFYIKDNLVLIHNSQEHTISTFTKDPIEDEYQFSTKINIDLQRIGRLTIKNKSELKKLLSQLDERTN